MRQDKTITNLQSRLDRRAIDQLRAEVVRLSNELEAAEQRAAAAESRIDSAIADADFWHDHAMDMMHQSDNEPPTVSLTVCGEVSINRAEKST